MTTVLDADLHETDPEADLLFGYPRRASHVCPGCGLRSEPYSGPHCWLCFHTGVYRRGDVKPSDRRGEEYVP